MSTTELENKIKIYPIKFTPILKQKVWGGDKLISEFNKVSELSNIGESWEISGVKESVSIVSNGVYKSISLIDLIDEFKELLIGAENYDKFGGEFPLLFKFIDASDNLSIQLHPNDILAKKRHNSYGKTEMWYVLSADDDALLYTGFSEQLDRNSYLDACSNDLLSVINKDKVAKEDVFFIESGTIHAIGKGVLLAEVQQTSDVTYRIYDWGRKGIDGKERELHTDLALDAINYSKIGSCEVEYEKEKNETNFVHSCEYFTTNKLNLDNNLTKDVSKIDSFIVYMCVEGSASFVINKTEEQIFKGETVLIPAICEKIEVFPNQKVELLEVYIN